MSGPYGIFLEAWIAYIQRSNQEIDQLQKRGVVAQTRRSSCLAVRVVARNVKVCNQQLAVQTAELSTGHWTKLG